MTTPPIGHSSEPAPSKRPHALSRRAVLAGLSGLLLSSSVMAAPAPDRLVMRDGWVLRDYDLRRLAIE